MYKNQKILAVITARGGSKGVPKKNIKLLAGKPLISYVIRAGLNSKLIDRLIVSTDDQEIAEISKKFKAEVPFLRPKKLATDLARSVDVLIHAVLEIEKENDKFDVIVLIQPTTPLLTSEDIDLAIKKLTDQKNNSCITITEIVERPEWMFKFSGNRIIPYKNKCDISVARQDLEKLYISCGGAFVVKRNFLIKNKILIDKKNCSAIVLPRNRSIDINKPLDFIILEALIKNKPNV